ncbi:PD40 domain-containing protein, partial [candidate division KSB1 bacterium]|nr:PD40 domain-containing protein [candidate division KSB1 bacterium]
MENASYKLTELKILDLKSKKAKTIAERKDGYMYKHLAWSADGKQILTAIEKDKKSKFILQPVDGSDAYEVDLEFEESKFPRFIAVHPKGKTIAYSSGRNRTDIWV